MDKTLVYNASVSIAQHPNFPEERRFSRQLRSRSHGGNVTETHDDDLEFASFETALDSPSNSPSNLAEESFASTVKGLRRNIRHRTVDIATLKAVARGIEIDDILDGCEDVQDEGAPKRIPMNELGCYFQSKSAPLKSSPACSMSTVDTACSLPGTPIQLPPSSSQSAVDVAADLKLTQANSMTDVRTKSTANEVESLTSEAKASQANVVEEFSDGSTDQEVLSQASEDIPPAACGCGWPVHYREHHPEIPIFKHPSVETGSYEEALVLAKAEVGHWVTILERSQSLDSYYKHMGLGTFKRAIMNRLAVPLTFFLEKEDTVVHVHVHTPLGIRHMHGDLTGKVIDDHDPDCGKWDSQFAGVVDYSIDWFCNGRPVRALRMKRVNQKVGTVYETRCVLPDKHERRVLLYNFVMYPFKDPNNPISTDRILRYMGPTP